MRFAAALALIALLFAGCHKEEKVPVPVPTPTSPPPRATVPIPVPVPVPLTATQAVPPPSGQNHDQAREQEQGQAHDGAQAQAQTQTQALTPAVAPPQFEALMKAETYPERNAPGTCCVCLSDSDFPDWDLKAQHNMCTEWLRRQHDCGFTLIAPWFIVPGEFREEPSILRSAVTRIPKGTCSEMRIRVESHANSQYISGNNSRMEQVVRELHREGKLPHQLLFLSLGGCNTHKYPEAVADKLQKFRQEFGIAIVKSYGSQTFDPPSKTYDSGWMAGSTLEELTPVGIQATAQGNHFSWVGCLPPNTPCDMGSSHGVEGLHEGMSWRCRSLFSMKPKYQYCCERKGAPGVWEWTDPQESNQHPPCKERHPNY